MVEAENPEVEKAPEAKKAEKDEPAKKPAAKTTTKTTIFNTLRALRAFVFIIADGGRVKN